MPTADTPTAPELPPLCYARQPSTGATVLIVRGEPGTTRSRPRSRPSSSTPRWPCRQQAHRSKRF